MRSRDEREARGAFLVEGKLRSLEGRTWGYVWYGHRIGKQKRAEGGFISFFGLSSIVRSSFVVVRSVCFLTVLHETSAELESDAFYGGLYFAAPISATRVASGAEFAELCGAKRLITLSQ